MATASVAALPCDDEVDAQQARIERGRQLFAALSDFPDPLAPVQTPAELPHVRPAEGWVDPSVYDWCWDPLGVGRAYHDIVPDSGRTVRWQQQRIAAGLRGVWAEMGFPQPAEAMAARRMCDVFPIFCGGGDGAEPMDVTVVNIVHTSYCQVRADADAMDIEEPDDDDDNETPPPAPKNAASATAPAEVAQLFLWRRLLHLGPQRNHVHTSLKLWYIPPFNASHILFQTGRVLETGATNMKMAKAMFYHCTVPYLRAAGLCDLRVLKRRKQNIVAKSAMPQRRTLALAALKAAHPEVVDYRPSRFTGAIVRFDRWKTLPPEVYALVSKAAMLLFLAGADVCVGSNSYYILKLVFQLYYPMLWKHSVLPQVAAAAAAAPQAVAAAGTRQRKRQRKRPRLDGV